MVISTALMIGGAIAGGVGGGLANKKRLEDQQDELDILALKNKQNYQEQKAAAIGLKNSMENQSIQATQGARKDAIEAFQAESSVSAAAGASGLRGGTPFYKMGQIAAEAAETINENARMRANQLQATRESGAAEIAGIITNGSILDKQMSSSMKSMNYLSSSLGWGQAILTGAVSGAEMGAKLSAGLESVGVDTGFDLNNLLPKEKTPEDAATAIGASGMGAAGVTDSMMGGAKATIDSAAAGTGNLNDYIAKYKVKPDPLYSGIDLGVLLSGGKSSVPDFGSKVDPGIQGLNLVNPGSYEGSMLLKKNQVPPSFDVFSSAQLF
jgi:hypothetical protein